MFKEIIIKTERTEEKKGGRENQKEERGMGMQKLDIQDFLSI